MNFILTNYFPKYSTDVLLISPGIVGSIFFLSRIWDAINDPLTGFLSDRTQTAFGKRIPWILGSGIPIALSFGLLWFPPLTFGSLGKIIWITLFLFLFFTAITALFIPHYSLGAEISGSYQERNRVFGVRAIFENIGNFSGVALVLYLSGRQEPREAASLLIPFLGFAALLLIFPIITLRKSADSANKKATKNKNHQVSLRSFITVFHNRKARTIFAVGFFSQLGAAFILAMTLYFTEYVLLDKEIGAIVMGSFMISATLTIPLWIYISRSFAKKSIWLFAKGGLVLGFPMILFIQVGQGNHMIILAAILGIFAGAVLILHPSMLSDTIRFDKEGGAVQKEGIYFSLFTFINKSALALAPAIGLWILDVSGFKPNQVQETMTQLTIHYSYALLPPLFFLFGLVILLFYQEDRS